MNEEFVTVLDTINGFETEFFKTFLRDNGFEVRESEGTPRLSGISNKLLQVPPPNNRKRLWNLSRIYETAKSSITKIFPKKALILIKD